ncbi:MAG: hypothetical protein ABIJ57_02325, partial [Pseudomonadota bacterium]
FKLSRKSMVLYEMGRFDNEQSAPKFLRAPFDLVKVHGGELCLSPVSSRRANSNPGQIDSGIHNDPADEAFFLAGAGDEWFLDREIVVIGEHEMGDFQGQPENWKGLHQFSWI